MRFIVTRYLHNLITALLLLLPFSVLAQKSVWDNDKASKETAKKKGDKTTNKVKGFKGHLQQWGMDTNYRHALLVGGKLNSDGWSGNVYFVKKKNHSLNRIWQIGASEIKHEKQAKQKGKSNPQFGNATPYVFGKINNLYTLQLGYCQERLLLPSVMEGNVSVSLRYSIGVSVAMLKPYYLKLIYIENIAGKDTSYLEEHFYSPTDSAKFLNPNAIFGSSKWPKSLNEIEYVPGGYFEIALAVLPGKSKTFIQAITLGVNGAYCVKKLPLMADQKAYPWQACLFAGFAIGKRWK